jgi:hypothetical protein
MHLVFTRLSYYQRFIDKLPDITFNNCVKISVQNFFL